MTIGLPRLGALLVAVVYLALGIAGFAAHDGGMGPDDGRTVLGFGVSALLNVVHVVVGVLGLLAARKHATSRAYGWFVFFGFAGLTAYAVLGATIGGGGDVANTTVSSAVLYGLTSVAGMLLCLTPFHRRARHE